MKRVGILTFQNALNYGALLQAYALQEACCLLGYDAKLINYKNEAFVNAYYDTFNMEGIIYENKYSFVKNTGKAHRIRVAMEYLLHRDQMKTASNKIKRMTSFIETYFSLSEELLPSKIKRANEMFDSFIVGSDQVWNMSSCRFDTNYYLDFTQKEKISYAASIGKEWVTGFEWDQMKRNLPTFKALSVREETAKKVIEERVGLDASVVLDPTLLHDAVFWGKIADTSTLKKEKEFILIYVLHQQTNLVSFAEKLAREEGLEVITLSNLPLKVPHKTVLDASVEDFLWYMKNAKYVMVTSFHGLAFSINFNRDLYYELDKRIPNNNSRLIDLSKKLGLEGREILPDMEKQGDIDWKIANQNLQIEREHSMKFLAEALGE